MTCGEDESAPGQPPAVRLLLPPGNELLQTILNHIPVMVDLLDETGQLRYVNREWERVLGWSIEDCQTRDLLGLIYPDPEYRAHVRDFIRHSSGEWREFTVQTREGRVLLTRWANIRFSDGMVIGIGEDITERKAAELDLRHREELFRSVIESTSDVVTVVARDGTLLFVSPSLEHVTGYGRGEREGQSAFDLVHPDDVARLGETLQRIWNDPGEEISAEYRLRHKDETWRWIESRASEFTQVGGRTGLVVSSRDITERKRLEEQLLHAQRLEAVGQLAGGIAHEFSNLLSIILCYADLLMAKLEPDSPLRGDAEQIFTAGERASAITSQLRVLSGRNPVQPTRLNLNELIERIAGVLGPVLGDKIHMALELAPKLGEVLVDPVQMEQVLLNLTINARDAMPDGGEIRFQTRVSRRYIQVVVRDTGVGMNEETRQHLFEPFFTTKESGRGTGLGLSTVYGILKRHGGTISVDSAPGAGSKFTIRLPPAPPA